MRATHDWAAFHRVVIAAVLFVVASCFLWGAPAAVPPSEARRLVDGLVEHVDRCRDYQCVISCYERMGEREEANRIWQESLKASPENETLQKTIKRLKR